MKANENKLINILNKQNKSFFCTLVLRLMDSEEYGNNYPKSLELVLNLFPECDKEELQKELNKYI